MKFKEEKEQLVKLGMKKQKVIDMEKKRDKIKRNIQKMKREQSLMLTHNTRLSQIKEQEIEEKTEEFKKLEQKIEEKKASIREQIEVVKRLMQDKAIKKVTEYGSELVLNDKKQLKKYRELNYTIARLNNLNYDSLPVCKEKEDKEKER